MKTVGYIRVSTPEQAKEGESLDTQRQAIEEFVKAKGKRWKLVRIYSDEGISGAKGKEQRPALKELYEDAKKKKFECVVIHRLSRFSRNARDLLNNVHALKENGVQLVSIKEAIDQSTPTGRLSLTVLSAVAEMEREIIDEQMRENKLARWKDGRTIVGRLPFGYAFNKQDKKIEVVPREAAIYKRIVSMYLDEGKSFKAIEEQLGDEGIKCRKKPWSTATISYALKNPIYYGEYIVNRIKYEGKRRTKEKKPASEHIPLQIPHPIISKTRWDQIQDQTQFNRFKGKHITIAEEYFLRDVLVCGECGGAIKPRHGNKRNDGSRPRYYSCYWRGTSEREIKAKEKNRCTLPYLDADEIENDVWYHLISYLTLQKTKGGKKGDATPYRELFDSKKYDARMTSLSERIIELENETKSKQRSRENLYTLLEKQGDHTNEFLERLQKIDRQLITLKSKIEDCKQEIETLRLAKDNDLMYKEFLTNHKRLLKRLFEDLNRLSPLDRKRMVDAMVKEKVKVWIGREDGRWEVERPRLTFNRAILQRFMDEGKIVDLNKNKPDHTAGYEF